MTNQEKIEELASDYRENESVFEGITVIAHFYNYEDYEGYASTAFEKDGVVYENYGSHCSCYGLEDQWSPEPIVEEQFRNNPDPSYRESPEWRKTVIAYLDYKKLSEN